MVVYLTTFLNGFEGILHTYIYPMIPAIQKNEILSLGLKSLSWFENLEVQKLFLFLSKLYILEQDRNL